MALTAEDKKEIAANIDDTLSKALAGQANKYNALAERLATIEEKLAAKSDVLFSDTGDVPAPLTEKETREAIALCQTNHPGHTAYHVVGHEVHCRTPRNQLAKFNARKLLKDGPKPPQDAVA